MFHTTVFWVLKPTVGQIVCSLIYTKRSTQGSGGRNGFYFQLKQQENKIEENKPQHMLFGTTSFLLLSCYFVRDLDLLWFFLPSRRSSHPITTGTHTVTAAVGALYPNEMRCAPATSGREGQAEQLQTLATSSLLRCGGLAIANSEREQKPTIGVCAAEI